MAAELGLSGPGWTVQLDPPVSAYLALEQRHPDFPGCETALLWHERHGWALAVEPPGGGDLVVTGYLGIDVLPTPATVARFVTGATGLSASGRVDPPQFSAGDRDGLPERLAAYAAPATDFAVRDAGCTDGGQPSAADPADPGPVRVETHTEPAATVLHVTGEIDMTTEDAVWEAVRSALADRPAVLVIDLSEVVFLGSAGLNVLVRAHQACDVSDLRVVAATRATRIPLRVTGLDAVLPLYPALPAALSATGISPAAELSGA